MPGKPATAEMGSWEEPFNQKTPMSADCTASAACASVVPIYFVVEPIERWPSACFTRARFTLPATRWEAKLCFRTCGCLFSPGKPASFATAWKIRKNCVGSNRPPVCEVNRKAEQGTHRYRSGVL
jgi:hypothetical protein